MMLPTLFDDPPIITHPGKEFHWEKPETVLHFLRNRKMEDKITHPSKLTIIHDPDGRLHLEMRNGSISRHPVRETFFRKLLAWHKLNPPMLQKLSSPTIVMMLNDLLQHIRREVIVTLEDNDALTLLSPAYTRTPDHEIIETWAGKNIGSITRNDFFTRIYFTDFSPIHPAPGDIIRCSQHFMNSETGFRSFEIFVHALRLVCSNGAVHPVDLPDVTLRHFHHGLNKESFDRNMKRFHDKIAPYYDKLEQQFIALGKVPCDPEDPKTKSLLSKTAGAAEAGKLLNGFQKSLESASTMYDLYNYITSLAKTQNTQRELFLQQVAGRLFREVLI